MDVSQLDIIETQDKPDIEVKFAIGDHGDGSKYAFDGKGKILIHGTGDFGIFACQAFMDRTL
jgi:hypothetical protein